MSATKVRIVRADGYDILGDYLFDHLPRTGETLILGDHATYVDVVRVQWEQDEELIMQPTLFVQDRAPRKSEGSEG
jgi:hypothetical protein